MTEIVGNLYTEINKNKRAVIVTLRRITSLRCINQLVNCIKICFYNSNKKNIDELRIFIYIYKYIEILYRKEIATVTQSTRLKAPS